MRKLIFAILFTISLVPVTALATVRIEASVDRTELALGESLELEITVHGGKGEVDTEGIDAFKVISRGSSTSFQMINGRFSHRGVYTFTLIPLREGDLTIPAIPVRSDRGTYYTREIAVSVTGTPKQQDGDAAEVFIEAAVSEKTPYEGQPIRYVIRVWQRVRIANAKFERPDFTGFTVKEIEDRKEYSAASDSREYHVTEVSFLLTPAEQGEKTIGAGILTCDLVRRPGQHKTIFDDPFFGLRAGRMESRVFRTRPVAVTVKPLPPYTGKGRFSGLVGRFDMDASLSSTDLRVGDSTTLAVTIQGSGNIMDAAAPDIAVDSAFKTYGDTPEEEIRPAEDGYAGKKTFRTALVPVRAGTYDLGPLEWVYFDVAKEAYVPLKTRAWKLHVRRSDRTDAVGGMSPTADRRPSKQRVAFVGRDILPLKEGMETPGGHPSLSVSAFWGLMAVPPLLWLLVRLVAVAARRKTVRNPGGMMAARAEKALRMAGVLRTTNGDFLVCLYRALVSAVLSRIDTTGESLTYAELSRILEEQGFSEDAAFDAARLLERIESARYSGHAVDPTVGKTLLDDTRTAVRKIIG